MYSTKRVLCYFVGSSQGELIERLLQDGKIVPSKITVDLIEKEITLSKADRILGKDDSEKRSSTKISNSFFFFYFFFFSS